MGATHVEVEARAQSYLGRVVLECICMALSPSDLLALQLWRGVPIAVVDKIETLLTRRQCRRRIPISD